MYYYLIEDKISYNKKTIYGLQGERVVVIANHHPAVLVMSETGNKFSCTMNELSIKPIIKSNATESKKPAKTTSRRKS